MAKKTKVIKLVEVLSQINKKDKKQFRKEIIETTDDLINDCENPVGYAIVVWSIKGEISSNYDVKGGVIGVGMIPTLVHDKLSRQIAEENIISLKEQNT